MIMCDANLLPEEIQEKAHEYVEKRKPRYGKFGVTQEDVECAWLNGFAFCLEGQVDVKVKQCAACVFTDSPCVPSDYAKDEKEVCNHYKNVFEENSELSKKNAELELKLLALEGQTPWSDIKDKSNVIGQLTKANDHIRKLLACLRQDTNDPQTNYYVVQCMTKAEQFLKENE